MIRFANEQDADILYDLCLTYHSRSNMRRIPVHRDKAYAQLLSYISAPRTEKILLVSEVNGQINGLLAGLTAEKFFSSFLAAYEVIWIGPLRLFEAFEYWAINVVHADEIVPSSPHHIAIHEKLNRYYKRKGYTPRETAWEKVLT